MDLYINSKWIDYRTDVLNAPSDDKLFEMFEFSHFLQVRLSKFELNPAELSIEDHSAIVKELKAKIEFNHNCFEEIERIIRMHNPVEPPFYSFRNDFVLFKEARTWSLYHKHSNMKVAEVSSRGVGRLSNSTKIAYQTNSNFAGQGIATDLVKLFISEISPVNGTFEILAANSASERIAEKCGFTFDQKTKTYLLVFDGFLVEYK